ncbi:hypothetical protein PAEPH01_0403 [Pancytospora epiphaga]|nr:hypothetical protein PAEPH01_0403 [Pancytospora epiphaga]
MNKQLLKKEWFIIISAIPTILLLFGTHWTIYGLCSMQMRHYKHNLDKIRNVWINEGMGQYSVYCSIEKVNELKKMIFWSFCHNFVFFFMQISVSVFGGAWHTYKYSIIELLEIGCLIYSNIFPTLYSYVNLVLFSFFLAMFISIPLVVFIFLTRKIINKKEQLLYASLFFGIVRRISEFVWSDYKLDGGETRLPIFQYESISDNLRNKITKAAEAHGVSKANILIRENLTINAAAIRGMRYKYIFINVGAIEALNDDQLMSVVYHELGHIKYNHTMKRTLVRTLYHSIIFGLTVFIYRNVNKYSNGLAAWSLSNVIRLSAYKMFLYFYNVYLCQVHECEADDYAAGKEKDMWIHSICVEKITALANNEGVLFDYGNWLGNFKEHPSAYRRILAARKHGYLKNGCL